MSEQASGSTDDASDALLCAVAHAPFAVDALAQVALPEALRAHLQGSDVSVQPALGAVVDERYRIEERLGAGGMGVVYAAVHLLTGKSVALKWMQEGALTRGERDQRAARRRFEREARIAANVRHPNVVDVYDASSDRRRSYLVMERLIGETLGARMRRGPMAWDELLRLLVPAMRGVSALHEQGVIHRDLKPDNIFLAREPGSGAIRPKVLDFGIAALRVETESGDESLTRAGAVIGTPGYMPLEQLRGSGELDERTDVYALGVVAYEALAGRRPFRAGNAAEHAAEISLRTPAPLAALSRDLAGERSRSVMKALARDPADRHPSVAAFIAALERARPPRRRGWPWLTAVACAGGAAIAAAMSVSTAAPAPVTHSAARHPVPAESPSVEPAEMTHPVTAPPAADVPALPPRLEMAHPVTAPPAADVPALPPRPTARVRKPRLASHEVSASSMTLQADDFVVPASQSYAVREDHATRLTRDDF